MICYHDRKPDPQLSNDHLGDLDTGSGSSLHDSDLAGRGWDWGFMVLQSFCMSLMCSLVEWLDK